MPWLLILPAGLPFQDVSGWEGADWFAGEGKTPAVDKLTFNRENWFPNWESEHRACREAAAAIDMSFMSKFLVVVCTPLSLSLSLSLYPPFHIFSASPYLPVAERCIF